MLVPTELMRPDKILLFPILVVSVVVAMSNRVGK